MKLYYIAQSCALASHIAACEAGIPVEVVEVDLATKKTATGLDFLAINPKGYAPALELDNGEVLTENAAILQYLADLKPEARLALAGHEYLLGNEFSVADAYLFALTRWAEFVKFDLSDFPHLQAFQRSISARPAAQAAMRAEGLQS